MILPPPPPLFFSLITVSTSTDVSTPSRLDPSLCSVHPPQRPIDHESQRKQHWCGLRHDCSYSSMDQHPPRLLHLRLRRSRILSLAIDEGFQRLHNLPQRLQCPSLLSCRCHVVRILPRSKREVSSHRSVHEPARILVLVHIWVQLQSLCRLHLWNRTELPRLYRGSWSGRSCGSNQNLRVSCNTDHDLLSKSMLFLSHSLTTNLTSFQQILLVRRNRCLHVRLLRPQPHLA